MYSSAQSCPTAVLRLAQLILPLWSLPPFLLLSLRTAALPCMRCASKAHHLMLRDTLLQLPAKRAVQCSWLACQLYILCPASGRLPADTVLVAPIADPCTKGFRKAKASRRTAGVTKLLEGASNLAYGRCPTAAAAANHTPRPAVGSPQLLPLQGSCYGLSTVSAWTAMLHLPAFCMHCEGPPCLPPACHPSAVASCPCGATCGTSSGAFQSPSASCPAGVLIRPAVSFATAMYNIYMDTVAAISSFAISSWVATPTLPICESPTPELCPVCTPPCQLPVLSHSCCPTLGLRMTPKT